MNKGKKNIFLIGFMGAGKSTIARAIKQKLGYPVVEMDERIVKEQGMPISKIFETYGELYFRELETKLIQSLNQQEPTIVSCGPRRAEPFVQRRQRRRAGDRSAGGFRRAVRSPDDSDAAGRGLYRCGGIPLYQCRALCGFPNRFGASRMAEQADQGA